MSIYSGCSDWFHAEPRSPEARVVYSGVYLGHSQDCVTSVKLTIRNAGAVRSNYLTVAVTSTDGRVRVSTQQSDVLFVPVWDFEFRSGGSTSFIRATHALNPGDEVTIFIGGFEVRARGDLAFVRLDIETDLGEVVATAPIEIGTLLP